VYAIVDRDVHSTVHMRDIDDLLLYLDTSADLPDRFDDLEDEDHDGDNEDIYLFGPDDYHLD